MRLPKKWPRHKKISLAVFALSLSIYCLSIFCSDPGSYRAIAQAKNNYVHLLVKNDKFFLVVSNQVRVFESRRSILSGFQPPTIAEEESKDELTIIENIGGKIQSNVAPVEFYSSSISPLANCLSFSSQPGQAGRLYQWLDGHSTQYNAEQTAKIRSGMKQYFTDQCRQQNWTIASTLFSREHGGFVPIYTSSNQIRYEPIVASLHGETYKFELVINEDIKRNSKLNVRISVGGVVAYDHEFDNRVTTRLKSRP